MKCAFLFLQKWFSPEKNGRPSSKEVGGPEREELSNCQQVLINLQSRTGSRLDRRRVTTPTLRNETTVLFLCIVTLDLSAFRAREVHERVMSRHYCKIGQNRYVTGAFL